MKTIKTAAGMKRAARKARGEGLSTGFVPTMGCLHEGHLSLIRKARRECGVVVVSIFVNPTQFGPGEDLKSYPADMKGDRKKCISSGVDILFTPSRREVYPDGFSTSVDVTGVTEGLCGASRPGHFRGVATVVARLFNIVGPHRAYFGMKDYQQAVVIKRMVKDLGMDARVITAPTVRENDGLAMSSRNVYLNPGERKAAARIYSALSAAKRLASSGEKRAGRLKREAMRVLGREPLIGVEYLSVVDKYTLRELGTAKDGAVMAVAVKIGGARLIDNVII